MNTQIQQLESRVAQLVARFNALLVEKQQLSAEVKRLRDQQQKLVADFQEERTQLCKQYELSEFQLEQNLQQTIDILQADKRQYEATLQTGAADLQALLQRFPQASEEA